MTDVRLGDEIVATFRYAGKVVKRTDSFGRSSDDGMYASLEGGASIFLGTDPYADTVVIETVKKAPPKVGDVLTDEAAGKLPVGSLVNLEGYRNEARLKTSGRGWLTQHGFSVDLHGDLRYRVIHIPGN